MEQREAIEMYLKGILRVENRFKRPARPIDLSDYLGVSKATVSEMLRKMSGKGYLTYESHRDIKLTTKGRKEATFVVRKYEIIKRFLVEILDAKVEDKQVHNEACRLEHGFSKESINKLEKILPNLKSKNFK